MHNQERDGLARVSALVDVDREPGRGVLRVDERLLGGHACKRAVDREEGRCRSAVWAIPVVGCIESQL